MNAKVLDSMNNNNIFLIGPMGAGKTTIGKQLARQLKWDFYDSDRVIEEKTGVDIALIFEKEGEEGFRIREEKTIDELTQLKNIVLATGGGAVLRKQNRVNLINRGTIFYLSSTIKDLVNRTSKDKKRPLLHGKESPKTIISQLIKEREPIYIEMADHIINTSNSSIQAVIKAIIQHSTHT